MAPIRPATLQDVADVCGISRGTASRALTGGGRVSPETRTRVIAAAAQLKYVTNSGARNLRRARAGAVGLWLPRDLRFMDYYMNFTFGLVEGTQNQDLTVSLIPGNLPTNKVAGLHVDGFVLADVDAHDALARAILDGSRPTVTSELVPPEMPQPSGVVAADHASSTRLLLDHLRHGGASAIGIVTPDLDQMWLREVLRAAREWSIETQTPVAFTLLHEVPGSSQLSDIVRGMLSERPELDAILCLPEGLSVGILVALQNLGRTVPDDVQLAAYTDSSSLSIVEPAISAIDLRPRDAGIRAGKLIVSLLADPAEQPDGTEVRPQREWLDVPFRTRSSTRGGAEN